VKQIKNSITACLYKFEEINGVDSSLPEKRKILNRAYIFLELLLTQEKIVSLPDLHTRKRKQINNSIEFFLSDCNIILQSIICSNITEANKKIIK
jgi:hypothetical protein